MKGYKIDHIDERILQCLQQAGDLSQRELAERVGLSQNACWRRLRNLRQAGIIEGTGIRLNREKLGLDLVVFAMIRTRHHDAAWLKSFRDHVNGIEEVVDFYRIGGDYDYLLKIVVASIGAYDQVYKRLIEKVELDSVTALFAMEAICEQRPLPVRAMMGHG